MSDTTAVKDVSQKYRRESQMGETWRRLKRNKASIIGLVILVLILLGAIFADVFFDYDDVVIKADYSQTLQSPSAEHPFGTDEMGRSILARVVHGSRLSLFIGFSTVAVALVVGGFFGALAGFYGGWLENIIMRTMDILLAIPGTLLAITIVAALGTKVQYLVLALAVSATPRFARIVRSAVLTVRDNEYIEAARAIGAKDGRIVMFHVLPNSMAPIIVQTTLQVASAILTIAGLSFIGLGIQPPAPEWGSILSGGREYIRDHSYMTFFPGMAIMLTILSLNLLGDGLRDALDPRLK